MIGQVVGKYRIAEKIGEGGMGAVYRAEHVMLGSPAAIKILLPRWTKNRQIVDRFFTEARAAGAIRHVGIVQVFDAGRLPNGQAFIAMELLLGIGLGELLVEQGVMAPPLAVAIGGQILGALDAAHAAGVIHRDLKPDNIQLVRDPTAPAGLRAKLLDFGIAKLLGSDGKRAATRSGALLGTPAYMSPEQCAGRAVDSRADLYAAGCILFEMFTGHPPFDGPANADTVAMHLHATPPQLCTVNPTLPTALEQLIQRMLAKDPEQRTPSAAWALAALERVSFDSTVLSAPHQAMRGSGPPELPGAMRRSGPPELPGAMRRSGPPELPGAMRGSGPPELPGAMRRTGPPELPEEMRGPRAVPRGATPVMDMEGLGDPFHVDTAAETAAFNPIEADFTEPHSIEHMGPDFGGPMRAVAPVALVALGAPPRGRRWVPLIVIGVALLIAGAAVVLIGRSAELPTTPAPR